MFKERIFNAQQGDQEAMLQLIEQFTPLLKKYAYKLHTDDALSELTLKLIELVHAIKLDKLNSDTNGAIVNYIANSIRHAYIALLKVMLSTAAECISWDMLTDAQKFEQPDHSAGDTGEQQFRQLLCEWPALTKKEQEVLLLSIYYEYPSAEIAKMLFSSRQNINQIKLRALKKMRDIQRDG